MRLICSEANRVLTRKLKACSLSLASHYQQVTLLALFFLLNLSVVVAEDEVGKKAYMDKCASCHGALGEGVAGKYDEVLYGDRTLVELQRIVDETMPKDAADQCVGEEAKAVAQYMIDTFYTAEARAKNRPPRIDVLHLTYEQYLNSVVDLFEDPNNRDTLGDERGFKAEYYNAKGFDRKKLVIERTDEKIDFQFGAESPDKEKIGAEEFSMRWSGAIYAEETGEYEFIVRSENGIRLYINEPNKALIDAWVASGTEPKDHVTHIRLAGGRTYPIKVEFFKSKDKSASVQLLWIPPNGVREVITKTNVAPKWSRPKMIVQTPFPADDRSIGYPRGGSLSQDWDLATTNAAIEVAGKLNERLDGVTNTKSDSPNRLEEVKKFCYRVVERGLKHPLTDDDRQRYVDRHFAEGVAVEDSVRRSMILLLKSPEFLFVELAGTSTDQFATAARLSYAMWDALPDQQLLQRASAGKLGTIEEVREEATRMLADARAKVKLKKFFHHWLQVEEGGDLSKDGTAYPGFNADVASDMRKSLDLFVDEVVWNEKSDYRNLFTSQDIFLNERLANFYGVNLGEGKGFRKASLDAEQRAGILTHPYLLTTFSYFKSTSPIHRGVFVTRKLLSRSLKPPPMAIEFMDDRFDPNLTMREKVAELTKPAQCQTCHRIINPLGFSLENFDAVGRFRETEQNKPVDSVVEYLTENEDSLKFDGAKSLAAYIAANAEAQKGFVEHLFHAVMKQPVAGYGSDRIEKLHESFVKSEFNIQKLFVECAVVGTRLDLPTSNSNEASQ